MLITCIHVDCLPGALNVRRRAPSLYKKLLKGLYSPVPNKTMYNDSRITGSPDSGSANSRGDDLDRTESYPLSISVLPKRQRKRFFLPGKEIKIQIHYGFINKDHVYSIGLPLCLCHCRQ